MAKRKKTKKTYRRRRLGSAAGMQGVIMKVAGIGVGAVAGTYVKKMVPTLSPTIVGAGEVVLGVMLPKFVKNNPLIDGIGSGLIAKGALDLATSMNLISGIGGLSSLGNPYLQPGTIKKSIAGKLKPIGRVDQTTKELVTIGALVSN